MLGEGLFCVSASVRQTLETGFIILWILESGFDALRFEDRGDLPAAGIGDGVIALVSTEPVAVCLGTIVEQVNMAGRVPPCVSVISSTASKAASTASTCCVSILSNHACTSAGGSASPGFSHRLTLKTLTPAALASSCWLIPHRSLVSRNWALDNVKSSLPLQFGHGWSRFTVPRGRNRNGRCRVRPSCTRRTVRQLQKLLPAT